LAGALTHSYALADVERLLRIPRETIRALVAAGFVAPERGPRNALRFSFQDLIVLRTAQSLVAAKLPTRRINRALKSLRAKLPAAMPLSGLSIGAVGDQVVVKEGGGRWQADSGQYLLAFEGDPAAGALHVVERKPEPPAPADDAWDEWFARGVAAERDDPAEAARAYRKAIEADPSRLDAWINLGLLQHEGRRLNDALRTYLEALDVIGAEGVLLFNLGVLLEDMQRRKEAQQAYEGALRVDPRLADAHYNLALLLDKTGKPREAIQHMAQYRKLAGRR
jgi:tetratricopeptide (TPR) repeat protein